MLGCPAGLYYRYGIEKVALCDKLSGIYEQTVMNPQNRLMRGFDDAFLAPHSRYTDVPLKEVLEKSNLQVLAQGGEVGLSILASPDLGRSIVLAIWSMTVIPWPKNTSGMSKQA